MPPVCVGQPSTLGRIKKISHGDEEFGGYEIVEQDSVDVLQEPGGSLVLDRFALEEAPGNGHHDPGAYAVPAHVGHHDSHVSLRVGEEVEVVPPHFLRGHTVAGKLHALDVRGLSREQVPLHRFKQSPSLSEYARSPSGHGSGCCCKSKGGLQLIAETSFRSRHGRPSPRVCPRG